MISTASGRSASIVAAGLLVLLASPGTAATGADDSTPDSTSGTTAAVTHRPLRHAWHHRRHYTHRRSHAIATKSDDKGADRKVVTAEPAPDNKTSSNIPPSIANANARMLLAGVQLTAAAAIPSVAGATSPASDNPAKATADSRTFMVAADQLNDVDKTLQEGNSTPAVTSGAQPAPASPAPIAAAATMTSESSTWDQTSLIGKIFIGFGALLTMASAARLFIG
jgi:hypothetical protein